MSKLLIDLPEEILGQRVMIRPYRPGDGAAVFEAVNETRDNLLPWIPWANEHQTIEESEAMVRRACGNFILREDLTMAIFQLETGRYLGGTGLHRIDWNARAFEIGYWIRASGQGQGYVSETVLALTQMALDRLSANRVFIRCAEGNNRSWAVPERLGFHYEGTLLNQVRESDGTLHNMRHYVMTPEIWAARLI